MTRSTRFILLAALVVAALAGCATTAPDPNYSAYVRFVETQSAADHQRFMSIAGTAESCKSDGCVQQVAALAALAQAAGGRGGAQLQPYRRDPSAWERFGLAALGAVPGLAQAYATIDAGRNSVEIARVGAQREIAITEAWSATTTGVAGAFAGLPPSTSISVGGDYVPGSQHIGDAIGGDVIRVGRDNIGGDQHIGDAVGGDQIGGDRIDGSNIGSDNRIGSDGPIETGDRCAGELCQAPPPPPTPPPADPEG
jgi:hypothetical protein